MDNNDELSSGYEANVNVLTQSHAHDKYNLRILVQCEGGQARFVYEDLSSIGSMGSDFDSDPQLNDSNAGTIFTLPPCNPYMHYNLTMEYIHLTNLSFNLI